nr:hypothetical protein EDGQKNGF_EDGQKNGF_CDS_0009 [Microvirus sp.]
MYNQKVIDLIEERGVKKKAIAKHIGISETALKQKVYGKYEFKASELRKLQQYLRLTDEELKIFMEG